VTLRFSSVSAPSVRWQNLPEGRTHWPALPRRLSERSRSSRRHQRAWNGICCLHGERGISPRLPGLVRTRLQPPKNRTALLFFSRQCFNQTNGLFPCKHHPPGMAAQPPVSQAWALQVCAVTNTTRTWRHPPELFFCYSWVNFSGNHSLVISFALVQQPALQPWLCPRRATPVQHLSLPTNPHLTLTWRVTTSSLKGDKPNPHHPRPLSLCTQDHGPHAGPCPPRGTGQGSSAAGSCSQSPSPTAVSWGATGVFLVLMVLLLLFCFFLEVSRHIVNSLQVAILWAGEKRCG